MFITLIMMRLFTGERCVVNCIQPKVVKKGIQNCFKMPDKMYHCTLNTYIADNGPTLFPLSDRYIKKKNSFSLALR